MNTNRQNIKSDNTNALKDTAKKVSNLIPESKQNFDELPIVVDDLKLYFGKEVEVPDAAGKPIIIKSPTVGDFIKYGENAVYGGVSPFITNPTSCRLVLWQQKMDWNEISEFQLFLNLLFTVDLNYTKLFFPKLEFQDYNITNAIDVQTGDFRVFSKPAKDGDKKGQNLILALPKTGHLIDYDTFRRLAGAIRHMLNIKLKNEYAKDRFTKKEIIREEYNEQQRNKTNPKQSNLLRMISFCLNHPGFKYKKSELEDIGIFEFLDSVKQLQVYETTNALIKGSYSGFIDTKKIDKTQFDFMRDLNS